METTGKIYAGLGGLATVFVLIGGMWTTSQTFATDAEVAKVVSEVSQMHIRDKVSAEEARKNDRIDRVDRDIRKLNRAIEFGDPAQRLYNEAERFELMALKQNIIEGIR